MEPEQESMEMTEPLEWSRDNERDNRNNERHFRREQSPWGRLQNEIRELARGRSTLDLE